MTLSIIDRLQDALDEADAAQATVLRDAINEIITRDTLLSLMQQHIADTSQDDFEESLAEEELDAYREFFEMGRSRLDPFEDFDERGLLYEDMEEYDFPFGDDD